MATIKRIGYGQVEPNHLSGIVTGQIYAQLPAMVSSGDSYEPVEQLEQGQFLKYDYANECCDLDGDGEFMLVYCEEKLYDERYQSHKDFVLKATDFTDGKIFPRLIKTNVGDIMTLNSFEANTSNTAETTGVDISEGDYLQVDDATGFLAAASSQTLDSLTGMVWKVVKIYTMPDSQQGVKVQRVQ